MSSLSEDIPLSTVQFALNVEGQGFVVLCEYPDPAAVPARAGDVLEFVRPDGSTFCTSIRKLHMVKGSHPGLLGLALPSGVSQDDVPYGSKMRIHHAAP